MPAKRHQKTREEEVNHTNDGRMNAELNFAA